MLDHNVSLSLYMAHGGTSFGFTSGANCPPFLPLTTSYDYSAPISDAGWETAKASGSAVAPFPIGPGRQVCASTRRDAEEFFALAPRVPVRTTVQTFPLTEANEALQRLRTGQIHGAAVLVPAA